MFEQPRLSGVAIKQLAAWEDLARGWTAYEDQLAAVRVMRCASCHVSLYRLTDEDGRPYTYSEEQILVQVVAHLRQAHMELDPDRG